MKVYPEISHNEGSRDVQNHDHQHHNERSIHKYIINDLYKFVKINILRYDGKAMKVFSENRKAGFNYEIVERFEAGVALNGQEAKSIKTRGLSLAGSYIIVKPNGVFWIGTKIPAYQPANAGADYHEERDRKLLLHKREIAQLNEISCQKGLTFIPLRLYTKGHYEGSGKIKLEFGVGHGKKKFDKRETLKKRDVDREIQRTVQRI